MEYSGTLKDLMIFDGGITQTVKNHQVSSLKLGDAFQVSPREFCILR
ncbi:MAG TPA: hypothetical protein VJ043_02270 [Candidatus Paceibacterota bacterium]|nr:hypothetical protein [Candidatus Paceibacterota bacterium]